VPSAEASGEGKKWRKNSPENRLVTALPPLGLERGRIWSWWQRMRGAAKKVMGEETGKKENVFLKKYIKNFKPAR